MKDKYKDILFRFIHLEEYKIPFIISIEYKGKIKKVIKLEDLYEYLDKNKLKKIYDEI